LLPFPSSFFSPRSPLPAPCPPFLDGHTRSFFGSSPPPFGRTSLLQPTKFPVFGSRRPPFPLYISNSSTHLPSFERYPYSQPFFGNPLTSNPAQLFVTPPLQSTRLHINVFFFPSSTLLSTNLVIPCCPCSRFPLPFLEDVLSYLPVQAVHDQGLCVLC